MEEKVLTEQKGRPATKGKMESSALLSGDRLAIDWLVLGCSIELGVFSFL